MELWLATDQPTPSVIQWQILVQAERIFRCQIGPITYFQLVSHMWKPGLHCTSLSSVLKEVVKSKKNLWKMEAVPLQPANEVVCGKIAEICHGTLPQLGRIKLCRWAIFIPVCLNGRIYWALLELNCIFCLLKALWTFIYIRSWY